jgi:hypothetical protein
MDFQLDDRTERESRARHNERVARLEAKIKAMSLEQMHRMTGYALTIDPNLNGREAAEALEAWLNGEAACDDAAEQRAEQTDLRNGG